MQGGLTDFNTRPSSSKLESGRFSFSSSEYYPKGDRLNIKIWQGEVPGNVLGWDELRVTKCLLYCRRFFIPPSCQLREAVLKLWAQSHCRSSKEYEVKLTCYFFLTEHSNPHNLFTLHSNYPAHTCTDAFWVSVSFPSTLWCADSQDLRTDLPKNK